MYVGCGVVGICHCDDSEVIHIEAFLHRMDTLTCHFEGSSQLQIVAFKSPKCEETVTKILSELYY